MKLIMPFLLIFDSLGLHHRWYTESDPVSNHHCVVNIAQENKFGLIETHYYITSVSKIDIGGRDIWMANWFFSERPHLGYHRIDRADLYNQIILLRSHGYTVEWTEDALEYYLGN